jgi:methyl-accepting chemotaxis protein
MKLKNLSYKSKLLFVIVPFIGIILILLFITSTFISEFATHVTSLANEELQTQKYQTLLSDTKDLYTESNALLYQGKDALIKLEHKEDQAAENFLVQLDVLSGKISTITGQLYSLNKKATADRITENYSRLKVELKKWGDEVNQKKLDYAQASDQFKLKRKLIKSFLKDNVTFEEGKSSVTPEILNFVLKEQSNFRLLSIIFIAIIVLITAFSIYLLINMTRSLNLIIDDLKLRFDNLNKMSLTVSGQSNNLSSATQEQTASLQETASTMEEITSMTKSNSTFASSSKEEIIENSKLTTEGTNYINEMIETVDSVKNVSEQLPIDMANNLEEMNKIVKVIQDIHVKTKIINDIVFQTKLLSFNASVEAARAGENGKGFSVVADEIGKLAQMSGEAAKEISQLLNESTTIVTETIENNKKQISKSVENISQTAYLSYKKANGCHEIFSKISSKAGLLSQMIESIVQSSQEQATGAEQINTALSQLDQVSNQNYLISTEVSKAGEELRENARALELTINNLDIFVKGKEGVEKLASS